MAMRRSAAKPLRSVVDAVKSSNGSSAARAFATTVSRPKELAGDVSDRPNLRVGYTQEHFAVGEVIILTHEDSACSARRPRQLPRPHSQPSRPTPREGRSPPQIRPIPALMPAKIHPTVRNDSMPPDATCKHTKQLIDFPSGRMSCASSLPQTP